MYSSLLYIMSYHLYLFAINVPIETFRSGKNPRNFSSSAEKMCRRAQQRVIKVHLTQKQSSWRMKYYEKNDYVLLQITDGKEELKPPKGRFLKYWNIKNLSIFYPRSTFLKL